MSHKDFFDNATPITHDSSNHRLLAAWEQGSQRAADILVQRYLSRLTALARSRLSRKLQRRVDPEDAVFSAWRSFFVAAQMHRVSVPDDDNLWPLLLTFTLRKVSRQVDYQGADQRSMNHEERGSHSGWLAEVASRDPSPESAALLADEMELLLQQFDERDRDLLSRRLRGEPSDAIAIAVGCSPRTIRRVTERAREWLEARRSPEDEKPQAEPLVTDRDWDERLNTSFPVDVPTISYRDIVLQQWIGAGGFGKVYRGIDKSSDQIVAVKFLRRVWWDSGIAVAALLREAELLRGIHDERIVACRGWGRTPHGAVFLVMDWIAGETLADWRTRVRPGIREVIETVVAAAEALSAVHLHGIMHGDLKPENVLRSVHGRIVLTDFGMARVIDPRQPQFPIGGTAGFLAPEQCSEAFGPISVRTDVYGLAALLYATATGHAPYRGCDIPEIVGRVISSNPPPRLSSQLSGIESGLDHLVARCLSKFSEERPASVDEFLGELRLLTHR